jgi:DNA-binding winged helix-turn-helix (wHTH) protein
MGAPEYAAAFGRLTPTPATPRFHSEFGIYAERASRNRDTNDPFRDDRTEHATATSTEIVFGPFRLLARQFLLLEDDKIVPLGSRALQILIVLLERPGDVINKKELMNRVWPNVFVEPANLTVHISALRRALRDGREENRFIINIPGRGYSFVASVAVASRSMQMETRTERNASSSVFVAG